MGLIPARGGSKRAPGKNVRLLAGHPLIAYTVSAALQSGEVDKVLVSSDDPATLEIAASYGADVLRRPDELAGDTSPDIEWVSHALGVLGGSSALRQAQDAAFRRVQVSSGSRQIQNPESATGPGHGGEAYEIFAILRPTSPFRKPETIRRAFAEWRSAHENGERYSSLRAVEKVSQHPGKMWRIHGRELVPLLLQPSPRPWHDSQYAALPEIYVQNASLEIAWTRTVKETGTISGPRILPFLTRGHEGFDVNTEHDWLVAELMVARGEVVLAEVGQKLLNA